MNLIYLVLAMAVVTYIPRMLPLVLLQNVDLPPYFKRFMMFIPYAALGALVFPGVLSSTGNFVGAAITGGITALLLAWAEVSLVFVIAGSIAVTFFMNIVF